jgi:hypothetical protein
MKEVVENILNKNEARTFSRWALGEDFETLMYGEYFKVWNERHGKMLQLRPDGQACFDIPEMILLWKNVA